MAWLSVITAGFFMSRLTVCGKYIVLVFLEVGRRGDTDWRMGYVGRVRAFFDMDCCMGGIRCYEV